MIKKTRRRDLIVFESNTAAAGTNIPSYTELLTEWGRFEEVGGVQNFRGEEVNEVKKIKIRVPKREGITPKLRIKFVDKSYATQSTRYFEIESVVEDRQRNKPEFVLTCNEIEN